jgi:hypothetical protein
MRQRAPEREALFFRPIPSVRPRPWQRPDNARPTPGAAWRRFRGAPLGSPPAQNPSEKQAQSKPGRRKQGSDGKQLRNERDWESNTVVLVFVAFRF